MTTEAKAPEDSSIDAATLEDELSVDALREHADLQTQPAEAVVDKFSDWEEFVEFDGDFEDIAGVGPASAGSLDGFQAAVDAAHQPSIDGESDDSTDSTSGGGESDGGSENSNSDSATDASDDEEDDGGLPEAIENIEHPGVFEITASQRTLAEIFENTNQYVDEFRLRIFEDKLQVCAVDPANVMMGNMELEASAFDSWTVEPGVLGFDAVRLADILNMANKDDEVHLKLDAATRKVTIELNGLEYTMGLLDPKSIRTPPELPEGLELTAEITLGTKEFEFGLKAADKVSDHVHFGMDETDGAFTISAEGDSDNVDYEPQDEAITSVSPGLGDSLYSLEYMKQIKKIAKDVEADDVTVRFGDGMPVKVELELADENGKALLILAPRIQSS